MNKDIERILVSEDKIEGIITELAEKIDRDYSGSEKKLLLLCILKGSVVFMGELMKKITIPVEIDFMKVSSYGSGTVSSGRLNILLDITRGDMADLDIIVIEDIIDSGRADSIPAAVDCLNNELLNSETLAAEKKRADFAENDELAARSAALYVLGKGLINGI